MVYNHLPNNTMWMSVSHLNDFINTSFAVDLSVVANRQSMLRAVNRMRSVAPFTRNSRFPSRQYHVSLEGEWYSVFMRLTQLLSQRDRAANITSSQTDNIRTDNNMRALFAVVEEINELRTRRHGFLDRDTFEEIYPWEETLDNRHETSQIEQLQKQMRDIASSIRMSHTSHAPRNSAMNYTDEEIRIMANWSRPYSYSAVKDQMVIIKRTLIDDLMNNPTIAGALPCDDDIRNMAMSLLDEQHYHASVAQVAANVQPVPVQPAVAPSVPKEDKDKTFGDYVREMLEDGEYDVDGDNAEEKELIRAAIAAVQAREEKRAAAAAASVQTAPANRVQSFGALIPPRATAANVAVPVQPVPVSSVPTFGALIPPRKTAIPISPIVAPHAVLTSKDLFAAYPGFSLRVPKDPNIVTAVTCHEASGTIAAFDDSVTSAIAKEPDPMASVAMTAPSTLATVAHTPASTAKQKSSSARTNK